MWPGDHVPPQQNEPTRAEWEFISARCVRNHTEQTIWAHGGLESDPRSTFDGTIGSLLKIYQCHDKSPFAKLRHKSKIAYASDLGSLKAAIGKVRVKQIAFDDIANWQDRFTGPDKSQKYRAGRLIDHLKRIFIFGALVLPKSAGCHDVCDIFAKMAKSHMMGTVRYEREEYMTAAQCRLLRAKAHEKGRPSVALEQAFAFELGLRQKDVIGEWVPVAVPGVSDVLWHGKKWMMGLRWEEIDADLVLKHRLSKSVRGNDAVMDAKAGKRKAWDLKDHPMIMDELARLCGGAVDRAKLPDRGPVIVHSDGRPWSDRAFRYAWRAAARAAGIPDNIQNRDSRPGAATEAKIAGAARDDVQRQLGHSKGETTEIYLREDLEENRKLARLRTEKRK